jgi:Calcineurin-like phosphoesterase
MTFLQARWILWGSRSFSAFFRFGVCLLLLLLVFELAWCQASTPGESAGTVFAIGDVHGDFEDFVTILQRMGLIDGQHHWTGGTATLVQTGDLLDRGPKPREVMDLLVSLEKEVAEVGGQVVGLIGNHEMMNIMGDLRYFTKGNFASFADGESKKRQKAAYQKYASWRNTHPELLAEITQPVFPKTETEWMAQHPRGYVEQREAFGPSGSYGKWLRKHSTVANINGVIFLHGGISPNVAKMKLDSINSSIANEIKSFDEVKQYLEDQKIILSFFNLQEITAVVQAQISVDRKSSVKRSPYRQRRLMDFMEYRSWLSVRPDGPLWFRGYDQWTDAKGNPQINKILKAYGADHIAVGHSVQKSGRIRSRFDGKVFLIDTGMLASHYPGGRASALEIRDKDKFFTQYTDQQSVPLEPRPQENNNSDRLFGLPNDYRRHSAALPVRQLGQ